MKEFMRLSKVEIRDWVSVCMQGSKTIQDEIFWIFFEKNIFSLYFGQVYIFKLIFLLEMKVRKNRINCRNFQYWQHMDSWKVEHFCHFGLVFKIFEARKILWEMIVGTLSKLSSLYINAKKNYFLFYKTSPIL
jgi:hypothetical protein